MPLIERENKQKPQRISVCLNQEVFDELSRYCQFLDSSCDHVIGALLQTMIPKDREYQAWKAEAHEAAAPEIHIKTETRGRKRLGLAAGSPKAANAA